MTVIAKEDFSGIKRIRPGVYGKFDSPTEQIENLDLNTLILIGRADNGPYYGDTTIPFADRYVTVSSFNDALKILKSGELLEAVNLAQSPARDTVKPVFLFSRGPRLFKLININPNTAAEITLNSTKAANQHIIKYPVPGTYGNKIRIRKILADKKIQAASPDGQVESPRLEKKCFEITYTGNGTSAILAISSTLITVTLTGQSDGSANLSVLFSDYPRLGDAVDYINSLQGYVAAMIDVPDFLLSNLDHIEASEAVDIKTMKTVYADLYAEQQYIEGTGLGIFKTNAPVRKPLADMAVFKFFQGAVTGTPGANDLKNAVDFSAQISGMFRNILSASTSDHAYFKTACQRMIEKGNETVGGCGGALPTSETFAQRLQNARALAGYVKYGISPFNGLDLNGIKKTYPGYMLAVLDNAISAAVSPRLSATHKYLNGIIDTPEVLSDTQIEEGIIAGGLVITQKNQNAPFWIERSVTTEVALNAIKTDSATFAGALTAVRTIRERMEPLVGLSTVDKNAKVQGVTEQSLLTEFEAALQFLVEQGYLVGSELLKIAPFDPKFKVGIDGDALYVQMKGRSFSVINFIFFLLGLEEIKGTV